LKDNVELDYLSRNNNGDNPLSLADKSNHREIKALFEKFGNVLDPSQADSILEELLAQEEKAKEKKQKQKKNSKKV